MNKKNLLRIGVALAAVAAILVATQMMKRSTGTEEVEVPVRPVKTMVVDKAPSQFRRVFPGRVRASQTVNLSFLDGGDLIELPATEGRLLQKGELVARLDDRDAQSQLAASRANLNLARGELERNRILFDEELISQSEFDVKQRSFEVAVAQFSTSLKRVEDREILAPFTGRVAERHVENFQKVGAGDPIITFLDPSGLDIIIDVPENIILQLSGLTSEITAVYDEKPDVSFLLEIREFATVADPYTKTYPLTLYMDRPEDITILPDMSVTVNVDFTRKAIVEDDSFIVPSTAIVYDVTNDGTVVWVVDEKSMVVNPREVDAERSEQGLIVINEGLHPGDIIVVAGGNFLSRDQSVKFFDQ